MADGLRVYFDFSLRDLLLYRQEREQYTTYQSTVAYQEPVPIMKDEPLEWVLLIFEF